MFSKQISVVRGQSLNLTEILNRCASPLDLVARPLVTLVEEVEFKEGVMEKSRRSLLKVKQSIKTWTSSRPLFSSC